MRSSEPSTANPAAIAANQRWIQHTNFLRFTLSASTPAGRVNKKKGSDAPVAETEIKNGERVTTFIIHIAALLCAATQVPEITVAIQSLLKAGFRRAVQVGLFALSPLQIDSVLLVSGPLRSPGILFRNVT